MEKMQVRIKYWSQDTQESGRFIETEPMAIDIARELVEMQAFSRAEIQFPDGFFDV